MTGHWWVFLQSWASIAGLAFDIVGALFSYYAVRITLGRAYALEKTVVTKTVDDVGSKKLLKEVRDISADRAEERIRASKLAGLGLAFFILGFCLQAVGSWPK